MGTATTRARDPRSSGTHRARLNVECLEGRLCLDKGFYIPVFYADALPGHEARLSGRVVDKDPSSVLLTFSGAAVGETSPDADGYFIFSTFDAHIGMVYVAGVNSLNQTAGNKDPLVVPRPTVTLDVSYLSKNTIILSGSVTDIDAGKLTVTFKGVATGSVATDESGAFSYTTKASTIGEVKATTVNLWSLRSVPASAMVTSAPPVIVNFQAHKSDDNVWVFSGEVQDEDPEGLIVVFSNLSEMNGKSTRVGMDGKFCFTIELHLTQQEQVHADVTDWFGLEADGAWVDIKP